MPSVMVFTRKIKGFPNVPQATHVTCRQHNLTKLMSVMDRRTSHFLSHRVGLCMYIPKGMITVYDIRIYFIDVLGKSSIFNES